jgi:flagellar motor switch protein FliG
MASHSLEKLKGPEKAAILMILLGDKAASSIYRHLPPAEVEELTREIARVGYVSQSMAQQILEEFGRQMMAQDFVAKGGAEYAQKVLVGAFGENSARDFVQHAMRGEAISQKDLEIIQQADPEQVANFVQEETPQTIALLLAHLDSKTSSVLLRCLPDTVRAEVVERLAILKPFPPELVRRIVTVISKKIQGLGKQNRLECGGVEAVAELLNRLGGNSSGPILDSIQERDPDLALAIRNQMFTFADFLLVADASIRETVAQVDKKVLALALKGTTPEVKDRFLKVMSSRAAEMLNEDIEVLGAVRARDTTHAQQDIVQGARKLEAEGKIILKNEEEETDV